MERGQLYTYDAPLTLRVPNAHMTRGLIPIFKSLNHNAITRDALSSLVCMGQPKVLSSNVFIFIDDVLIKSTGANITQLG